MRSARRIALMIATALAILLLGGCGGAQKADLPTPGPKGVAPAKIRLGVIPTEDVLPLWAAQKQGTFDKVGVTVDIVPFTSEQSRDDAMRAGSIDGIVGDVLTVAKLRDQGTGVRIVTVALGATPAQGRFGLVVHPGSRLRLTSQLAAVVIATSANDIDEYVLDGLMHASERPLPVQKQYVAQPSQRFDLLMKSQAAAAVLPEPYLSLAIKRGAHLIVDDTKGTNLSQTTLAFADSFLARPDGASAVNRLLGAWDAGSSAVNSRRKIFRPVLVEKASMPAALRLHYRMNTYPHHRLPTEQDISRVLKWMERKQLLRAVPTYDDMTWTPAS